MLQKKTCPRKKIYRKISAEGEIRTHETLASHQLSRRNSLQAGALPLDDLGTGLDFWFYRFVSGWVEPSLSASFHAFG